MCIKIDEETLKQYPIDTDDIELPTFSEESIEDKDKPQEISNSIDKNEKKSKNWPYHSDLFCQIWSGWDFEGYDG